ncbi:MAG: amidohydrolase family protein [Anaerolineae bacterium]|nr:amidohydrolase family protein [Anaerolineae bacterium]
MKINLSQAPIIDAHSHGFRAEKLVNAPPEGFLDRITVMGMCFGSATGVDPALAGAVSAMTDHTLMAMVTRRRLAAYLNCSPAELFQARHAALEADPPAYVSGLMRDANLSALLVDDGFPLPKVDQLEMQELIGVTIHRVARIEPMIEAARQQTHSAAALEEAFRAELETAAHDPRCVAFKSIIAYRTGLDVGAPTREEVDASYQRWQAAAWREGRETSKPLRDHLLNVTFEIAKKYERPVHIHSGAGDTDVVLSHARPTNLGPLLTRFAGQPTVLIHSGFPWLGEATYLASLYPLVYLELSLYLPWGMLDMDRVLTQVIGAVPTNKILYGSDEASEPEILWVSAKESRAALERVLTSAVERDFMTLPEAEQIGQAILARNVLRLHGLA